MTEHKQKDEMYKIQVVGMTMVWRMKQARYKNDKYDEMYKNQVVWKEMCWRLRAKKESIN